MSKASQSVKNDIRGFVTVKTFEAREFGDYYSPVKRAGTKIVEHWYFMCLACGQYFYNSRQAEMHTKKGTCSEDHPTQPTASPPSSVKDLGEGKAISAGG